jgi:hypothetical protein
MCVWKIFSNKFDLFWAISLPLYNHSDIHLASSVNMPSVNISWMSHFCYVLFLLCISYCWVSQLRLSLWVWLCKKSLFWVSWYLYAECHYEKYWYAECCGIFMLFVIVLSIVMLNVTIQRVIASFYHGHSAKNCYTMYCGIFILFVIVLSIVMLNVIMLRVVVALCRVSLWKVLLWLVLWHHYAVIMPIVMASLWAVPFC